MQTTLLGLAIALILALIAALIGPYFIDWNQFRPQFEAEATQIIGAPGWAASDRYDVAGVPNVPGEPVDAQMKSMMRKLLADHSDDGER